MDKEGKEDEGDGILLFSHSRTKINEIDEPEVVQKSSLKPNDALKKMIPDASLAAIDGETVLKHSVLFLRPRPAHITISSVNSINASKKKRRRCPRKRKLI